MAQLFYAGPNRQPLPVSEDVVDSLLSIGSLTPDSLVWHEGMAEWKPLKVVRPDLIRNGPPSLPTTPPPLQMPGPPVLPPGPAAPAYGSQRPAGRSHEIDYKIMGDDMQLVEIELDPGETVVAEAGSMNYMDSGIQFETKMGDGSNPNSGFMDKLKSKAEELDLQGKADRLADAATKAAQQARE